MLYGDFYSVGLDQSTEVGLVLEIDGRVCVVVYILTQGVESTVVSLVGLELRTLVSATSLGCEVKHSLPQGERLRTELAIEISDGSLIGLEQRPGSPDSPVVYVPTTLEPAVTDAEHRR